MPRAIIFADEEFDDYEVIYPKLRLQEAGFEVEIATRNKQEMLGKHGLPAGPTMDLAEARAKDFDLVIIPGGYRSPDRLRTYDEVLNFLKEMNSQGKVIGAICHGPWVLISAGILKGRKVTGHRGIRDDLLNAGATYLDEAAVVDGNLVTSRHPRDVAAFMKAILSKFEQ